MKCLLTISLLFGLFGTAEAAPNICKKEPLACNVYFESRGEKEKGQYAVAFVSINRLKEGTYGQSMRSVVFSKGQFSWTNSRGGITDPEAWAKAREIAQTVHHWSKDEETYRKKDFTHGAKYFHKTTIHPQWKKKMIAHIGKHVFYS